MKFLALIAMAFVCVYPNSGESYQTMENNASWIKECQDDRLYINTNHLEITDRNMLVRDESGFPIRLGHIWVDALGIFTTMDSLNSSDLATVWNIVWCKVCQAYRSTDIQGNCVKCGSKL